MGKAWIIAIAAAILPCNIVAARTVSHVTVTVRTVGVGLPALAEKRMQAGIQTVGNHVLLARDTQDLQQRQEEYNRTLNDIVKRVLIGYTVERIQLIPGTDTQLQVYLRPWGNTVRAVRVVYDYGAVSASGKSYMQADLQPVQAVAENALIGLPIDSLDWAGNAVQEILTAESARALPEFYPHITVQPGRTCVVKAVFVPKQPVIRKVEIRLHSENLPRTLFWGVRRHLAAQYLSLIGLPAAFVRRHMPELQEQIRQEVQAQDIVRNYRLQVLSSLQVGDETAIISLQPHTEKYDVQGRVYVDMGRSDTQGDTVVEGTLGRKWGGSSELFISGRFTPATLRWNGLLGYYYRWGPDTKLGIQYETFPRAYYIWFTQKWNDHWQVWLERNLKQKENELGIQYRPHEYMGIEYIIAEKAQWVRLIGYM